MKIIPIQALRAAAALSIAILHGQHEAGLLAEATGRGFTPSAILPWAAGVDVFFVISGYVMVLSSRGLFARPGARGRFLARRVARIVPLYWVVTTGYLALALAAPSLLNSAILEPGFVAASYLFWPMSRPDGLVQPLYSLGWTLNDEMFFYGLFALAVGLPGRAAVGVLVIGLAILSALGVVARWPQPLGAWTDPILLEFAAGLVLGLWRVEGIRIGRTPRLILGIAGLALLASVAQAGELAGIVRAVLWGLPAACLVAACGLGHDDPWREEGRLARFGAALGDAYYALYLVHPFVLRGFRELVRRAGLDDALTPWHFLLLALCGTLLAAHLVHRWVERPLTRIVRRALEPAPVRP